MAYIYEANIDSTNYLIEPKLHAIATVSQDTDYYKATINDFELIDGVQISLKIPSADRQKIKINDGNAISIYYSGSATLEAERIYSFVYDATNTRWELVGNIDYAAPSHSHTVADLPVGTGASQVAAGNHTHQYAGSDSVGGAANTVKVTEDNNTTNNKAFYPWYSDSTLGGLAAKAHTGFYLYEGVTNNAISRMDLCVGKSTNGNVKGTLTLHNGSGKYANISVGTLTSNVTYTLPSSTGTLALAATTLEGYGITDAVKKITSTDNAIAKYNGTKGDIQNSGIIIDSNNDLTSPGSITLYSSAATWPTNLPMIILKGADNRDFSFKFSHSGKNVDVGWDWKEGHGAGMALRSQADNNGEFVLYARKDTTAQYQLIGATTGILTWNNNNVITAADIASTTNYGITQLYDNVDSTSASLAATANAVKTAYDQATTALNTTNNLLSVADALVFKGILTTGNTVPSSNYSAGWTYKVGANGQYITGYDESQSQGDLIIAIQDAAENQTGIVPAHWYVLHQDTNTDQYVKTWSYSNASSANMYGGADVDQPLLVTDWVKTSSNTTESSLQTVSESGITYNYKNKILKFKENNATIQIGNGTLTATEYSGNAATATSATSATKDSAGNTISSYYCTLSTDQTLSGKKTFSANLVAQANVTVGTSSAGSLGIAQTNGTGLGLSLYGGPKAVGALEYGIMFAQTTTFGGCGSVTEGGKWATYFTMNRNDARGWIFKSNGGAKDKNNNVASIAGNGDIYTIGTITIKDTTAGSLTVDGNNAVTASAGSLETYGGIATRGASFFYKTVSIAGRAADNPLIVRGIAGCASSGIRSSTVGDEQALYLNYTGGPIHLGVAEATANSLNQVSVAYGSDSSDSTSGALTVAGGAGIAKNLYVGNRITAKEINATQPMVLSAGKIYSNITSSNVLLPAKTTMLFSNGIAIANPGLAAANDVGWIRCTGSTESNTVLEIATGDDGIEQIVARQYNTSSQIVAELILLDNTTAHKSVFRSIVPDDNDTYDLGASNNKWSNIYATNFTGNLTGNVTGNLTGNVTGNLTGNVTGDISGNAATITAGESTSNLARPVWFSYSDNGTSYINGKLGYNTNFMYNPSTGTLQVGNTSTGSILVGSATASTAGTGERQVGVKNGSGRLYLYAAAATNGNKGLYAYATNQSTGGAILTVNQSNQISAIAKLVCSATITGTLTLSRTQDVVLTGTDATKPALIIGELYTKQHLEFDDNEIQSKSNATTANTLFINNLGGAVDIGSASDGYLKARYTTDASSTSTGALQVVGGAGIAKKLYVGTGIYITSTSADNHLSFSRTGGHSTPNYINVPASSSLAFSVGGYGGAQIVAMIDPEGIVPYTTNTKSIGTSTYKWANVYATTFTGNLTGDVTGNADTATELAATQIKSETEITDGTKVYTGSGSSWTGSLNGMAYGTLLHIGTDKHRSIEIWGIGKADRTASNSLQWRHKAGDGNSWQNPRTILDNVNTYAAKTDGSVISISRNTETKIATINGVDIKIKIPASDNTNNAVTQTAIDTNGEYSILLKKNANKTDETTGTNYVKTKSVTVNPSTAIVSAIQYYATGSTGANSSTPGFKCTVNANAWSYMALESGTTAWHIAVNNKASDDNTHNGALQFRPNGSNNTGPSIMTTGEINRWVNTTSNVPLIAMRANNKDAVLWEIGHASHPYDAFSNHSYKMIYKGTGDGVNNTLQLVADYTSDTIAMQINLEGRTTFQERIGLHTGTSSVTEKVTLEWNSTDQSLDFIFA